MKHNSALVGTLIFLVVAASAAAYNLLDPPRRWFTIPRVVFVDSGGMPGVNDGDSGYTRALDAVEAWNDSPGGPHIFIVESQPGTATITLGDGVSNLVFDDPFNVCTGFCLAATFTGFYNSSQTGECDGLNCVEIADSDIVFNRTPPARIKWASQGEFDGCSNEIYLEPVVTHEVGHLIGLGHSNLAAALMYASVSTCDNKSLHGDDTAGRDALYDCNFGSSQCTPTIEVCDGLDNDCDGAVDEGFDADGDTYTTCGGDCDDGNPDINPTAAEVCGDGVDNNCNGSVDEGCSGDATGEVGGRLCRDGIDNDGDGKVDCADSECAGSGFCK